MSSTTRTGQFYPVWPILDGKNLQYQWGEIRQNTAETKALVRQSYQDIEDGVDTLNAIRAHIGQAFGDQSFSNKYRFIYDKTDAEFCVQKNDGTEAVPSWTDVWCIRFSDGQFQVTSEGGIQSNAGFYGPIPHDLAVIGEHGTGAATTFKNQNELYFNVEHGFYLTPNSGGKPVVNFAFPFGRSQTFTRTGREWQIQHNYGVTPVLVQVMNGHDEVIIPDKIDLSNPNIAYFYFHAVTTGKALIATGGSGAVELRPKDPFYLTVRTHTQSRVNHTLSPNAELIFDATFFYVNTNPAAQNPKAFVSLTSQSNIDHGLLLGLSDDDHTQYILADGTRAFTGQLSGALRVNSVIEAEAFYTHSGEVQAGVSDHGLLTGLGDDDHTQYTLADGTRAFTGTLQGNLGVDQQVKAEAFYVEGGGEWTAKRLLVPSIQVQDRAYAAGFYLNAGASGVGRSLNEDIISFHINSPDVDNYYLESFCRQGFIVESVDLITHSGSCTVGFYIVGDGELNPGVSITGFDPISASTTKASAAATGNNVVGAGDSILLSVPTNSASTHLRGSMKIKLSG